MYQTWTNIYKGSEFNSGIYDVISEDISRVTFKRFQKKLSHDPY